MLRLQQQRAVVHGDSDPGLGVPELSPKPHETRPTFSLRLPRPRSPAGRPHLWPGPLHPPPPPRRRHSCLPPRQSLLRGKAREFCEAGQATSRPCHNPPAAPHCPTEKGQTFTPRARATSPPLPPRQRPRPAPRAPPERPLAFLRRPTSTAPGSPPSRPRGSVLPGQERNPELLTQRPHLRSRLRRLRLPSSSRRRRLRRPWLPLRSRLRLPLRLRRLRPLRPLRPVDRERERVSRPISRDGGSGADTNIRGLRRGLSSAAARGAARPEPEPGGENPSRRPIRGGSNALRPPRSCRRGPRDRPQLLSGPRRQAVPGAVPCGSSGLRTGGSGTVSGRGLERPGQEGAGPGRRWSLVGGAKRRPIPGARTPGACRRGSPKTIGSSPDLSK